MYGEDFCERSLLTVFVRRLGVTKDLPVIFAGSAGVRTLTSQTV
jgi:hypothetical protein